ncbi:hypothetical protein Q31b_11950 [Novipirellula aureliae]|uniref:NfeD-like C-terminal domain-containing protein n=1 Tax=Novipirellula aureliae TaxID=2527966 RepID=A0A5C6EDF4_9BACT|nr:NfeD family protein [Novipirellula aureliae]TWU46017.1 hypothetical protein Q31b_11950 [Novipirellula aureliae]
MPLYYAYALLAVFYALLVLEFMIPSGGLVGIAAVVIVVAALAVAFTHSTTAGVTLLMLVAATTPLVFIGVIHVWPHTPIGRRILNRRPGQTYDGRSQRKLADGTPLDELVNQRGVAKTNMLPSGLILIDSRRVDAVSEGMAIDAGTQIVVTKIEAGKIHVRPLSVEEISVVEEPQQPRSPDSLENPPENFDFDALA